MIEASAEDPRITRRAPSLVPRVSPSCGAGGSEEGRRDPLARLPAAQGRQQGPTVPNGPGPGRRLECALPKQTAACGNPPPFPPATETAPRRVPWRLSRYRFPSIPREGRARGSLTTGRLQLASLSICPAACRSSSTQEYSGPSLSATRLLPLDHLSLSKPTLCFQGGKKSASLSFLVPGVGNNRGKIAQRKQAAERGSSRGSPPSGHRVVGRHWHRTKALTSCEPRYGAGATRAPRTLVQPRNAGFSPRFRRWTPPR